MTYKHSLIKIGGMSRQHASSDPFRAIADPNRRAMLDLLSTGERPVKELARSFRMTQPGLSQHLRVLREAGLVACRRRGREQVYRIRGANLKPVANWIAQYERFWTRKLRALDSEAAAAACGVEPTSTRQTYRGKKTNAATITAETHHVARPNRR